MEKGKVKTIKQFTNEAGEPKQWAGHGKTFDVYDIEIEQGAVLDNNYKLLKGTTMSPVGKESKFKAGQECQFTKEASNRPDEWRFKWASEQQDYSGGGKKGNYETPEQRCVGFAMSYAKDLVIAGKADEKKLTETADAIYNWMVKKLKA